MMNVLSRKTGLNSDTVGTAHRFWRGGGKDALYLQARGQLNWNGGHG